MELFNAKVHYDNCRFCWMCRQVCTVATMTSDESHSPRSRGMAAFAVEKGILPFDEHVAQNMYECCLCKYCNSWCEGDYDPTEFIIAARRDAVAQGLEPAVIRRLKDTLLNAGNVFDCTEKDEEFTRLWSRLPSRGDILLIAGSIIPYRAPKIAEASLSVLRACGVEPAAIDETTGGFELYCLGYADEARRAVEKLTAEIAAAGAKTIVTLDTQERYFLSELSKLFGLELTAKVLHWSEYVSSLKLPQLKAKSELVTYHDDSFLARYCGVTDAPRACIKAVPGCKYQDMLWFGEEAHATPSALFQFMYPNIADQMLTRRAKDYFKTQADTLITGAAIDRVNMRDMGIKAVSIQEYLESAL
ncbi:MAG: succinate dehydrogenase/fumarate reductase iron-sulfur subunit [Firmicutes bacterium ADurb.Bin182]|nr:MAG: succinate dehydrogenase/fumarate reductase iron-sulfur subunit [Firmicutes bacterium ADurb.Bin182]